MALVLVLPFPALFVEEHADGEGQAHHRDHVGEKFPGCQVHGLPQAIRAT
jgi:hypothetical protein